MLHSRMRTCTGFKKSKCINFLQDFGDYVYYYVISQFKMYEY